MHRGEDLDESWRMLWIIRGMYEYGRCARVLVEDVFQIVCVCAGGFQHQQPGRGADMLRADQLPNADTLRWL